MTAQLATYRKLFSRSATFLFYCLVLVFLLFYLQHLDLQKLFAVRIAWKYMLASFVLSLCVRYWGVMIWLVTLAGLGAKDLTRKSDLAYVFSKAWMGRYIPGTAPWIVGKIYFASQHGVSREKLAVGSLLEGGLQILVALTLGTLILFTDERSREISREYIEWVVAVMVFGLIFMLPVVFNRAISVIYKLIRKERLDPDHHVNSRLILKYVLLYSLGLLLNGLSLLCVVMAVSPEFDLRNTLFVIGANCFSGAISMLAVFAPSGIGVREGILLVLLNFIVAPELALVVVLLSRLWNILSDIAFWGMAYAVQRFSQPKDGASLN